MEQKIDKLQQKLLLYFWADLLITTGIFIFLLLGKDEPLTSSSSVIYERYAMILVLMAIPGALKLFHHLSAKIISLSDDIFLKKFTRIYALRASILNIAILVSFIGLYAYGAPNFIYLVIVLLLAKFFCFPSKASMSIKKDVEEDNDEEIDNNN